MLDLATWLENPLIRNAVVSALFVGGLLLGRRLVLRALAQTALSTESLRRWRVQIRNAMLVVLVFGLTIIWGSELRTLALSITAVAVAIVLATKELILCFTGALLRSSSRVFTIGDRVEVDGVRGDVVDMGPLTTTLLEAGAMDAGHGGTGRLVFIPNSVFLTQRVFNETQNHDFVLHTTTIPLGEGADVVEAEQRLIAAAQQVCASFLDAAARAMASRSEAPPPDEGSVGVVSTLHVREPNRVDLQVRFPVPARRRAELEQQVLRVYLKVATGDARPAAPTP